MLMQSNYGCIELLPALPTEWEKGSINGIVARGNFTLDIEWESNKLKLAKIISNAGGKCKLYYAKGNFIIDGVESQNGVLELDTQKGQTFILYV